MAADDKTEIIRAPDPVAVGTQLSGTYELDKRIASGGMGEVYRGHNIQTGDPVAIKIVLPEFARDQTILSLFRKEASILNHLFHEAIVRYHVFAIDQAIGRPYLAMEFVDGLSLVDMFEKGPMDPEDARRLLVRLASGLAVAHEAGVIHRDLSPDNIVLPGGKVERAKIIDFGIARSAGVGGETLLGGSFAGKYNFVSPEQLGMAGGEVTERSDIYSLGLVIAAVLRGRTINMTGSQVDVIEKRRVVPDLSGIDARMRPVLEAMLQPNPRDRPSSMAEIVEGLRDQEPSRARSLWDDPTGQTAPPVAVVAGKDQAPPDPTMLDDGWPPATSRTPAPWRVAGEPAAASVVSRPAEPADTGMPPPAENMPRRKGGMGMALFVVAAIAGLGGGGAYLGGYLDGLLPKGETGAQPEPAGEQPKPGQPQPSPPTQEQPQPSPSETPAQPPAAEPVPAELPAAEQPAPDQPASEQPQPEPPKPEQPQPAPPAQEQPQPEPPKPDQPAQQQPPAAEAPAEPPAAEPPATEPPSAEPEPPAQPAEEAASPPAAEPVEDPRLVWLNSYPGGDCFFASALDATGGKLHIEGFGSTVTPFEAMLESFKSKFPSDPEPDIGVRLVSPKQCPATQFMADLRDASAAAPKLDLARDVLFSGDPMAGGMTLDPERTNYLLLVDHDGIAHNLQGILKRNGDRAEFSVQLGLSAGEDVGKSPLPQMLVAFSTSSPVAAMQVTKPVPARDLFPAIEGELRNRGINAAATARYFRIRG